MCDSTDGCFAFSFHDSLSLIQASSSFNCTLHGLPNGTWQSDADFTSTYLVALEPVSPRESSIQLARFDHVIGLTTDDAHYVRLRGLSYFQSGTFGCALTTADCAVACLLLPSCTAFFYFMGDGSDDYVFTNLCPDPTTQRACMPVTNVTLSAPTTNTSSFASFYMLPVVMPPPSPTPPSFQPAAPPRSNLPAILVAVLEAVTLVVCLRLRSRLMRRYHASEGELKRLSLLQVMAQDELHEYEYHLFISYRRVDFVLVDQIASYCRETVLPGCAQGLRVFKDRDSSMTGQPFDLFLLNALANTAVFCPIISLDAMARLVSASPFETDFTLVEYILALHFKQRGRLRGIIPLLVGPEFGPESGQSDMWAFLPDESEFKRLRDSLPDVIPTASLDTALSLLRADDPLAALAPGLENATVRELMDASAAVGSLQLRGLLQHDWHTLEGRQQGLRGQVRVFASVVWEAARGASYCWLPSDESAPAAADDWSDSQPLLENGEETKSAYTPPVPPV